MNTYKIFQDPFDYQYLIIVSDQWKYQDAYQQIAENGWSAAYDTDDPVVCYAAIINYKNNQWQLYDDSWHAFEGGSLALSIACLHNLPIAEIKSDTRPDPSDALSQIEVYLQSNTHFGV